MRVLFLGDVFGTKGMEALQKYLPTLKTEYKPNLIFLNGENMDRGFGIDETQYKELMKLGVHAITLGNHAFSNQKLLDYIDDSNIIRPLNYGTNVPGNGYITINYNQEKVTLINVMGRIFMGDPLDNPFHVVDDLIEELDSDYIFIDIHAEATSEKLAFAHYFDGRVTGIVGTHTHVPTSDAMVLPNGTMYITDIGMTGAKYGILGADKDIIINKFLDGMRRRIKEDTEGPLQCNAVLFDTDKKTIQAINIIE